MLRTLLFSFCILHSAFRIYAAKPAPPSTDPLPNFVRFDEDGHGGGKMQTAVASYVNADGIQVDLLSTAHVAEPAFFRAMAQRFGKYDAVLYELVAHHGDTVMEEGVNDQQKQIADECGLENQGPHMTYERKNFLHADLDLEEIQKKEIALHGTFKGALGDGPGTVEVTDPKDRAIAIAISKDRESAKSATPAEQIRLKRRAYSREIVLSSVPPKGQMYPAGAEVLVGARNDKVMELLNQQIDGGRKKLAVFYGAAHMIDLEHRLFQLGFKRKDVAWQTAWTVAPDGTPTTQPARAKH